jgi:hypothetical protein
VDKEWERTELATLDAHDNMMKQRLVEEFKRK